ncbi:signal recognition particle-docking protein FtsY [Helicobacter sp. 23-1044]
MFSFFKKIMGRDSADSANLALEIITKDLLEERLIECDIEYEIIEGILDSSGAKIKRGDLEAKLRGFLGEVKALREIHTKPLVHLILGVNGAGKTTTIAKLGQIYKAQGQKVIFGAGDTFRAAAVEQLCAWGKRLEIQCVSSKFGADPAAVAFDSISAAKSRGADVAFIDTAGRLENKINLQNELKKIANTCQKGIGDFYKILILDGTQGTSAINQAKTFNEILTLDGIIITKMDGSSKGGCIISIAKSLKLPILFVGTGEGADDLIPFDKEWYVKNMMDYVFSAESQNLGADSAKI